MGNEDSSVRLRSSSELQRELLEIAGERHLGRGAPSLELSCDAVVSMREPLPLAHRLHSFLRLDAEAEAQDEPIVPADDQRAEHGLPVLDEAQPELARRTEDDLGAARHTRANCDAD